MGAIFCILIFFERPTKMRFLAKKKQTKNLKKALIPTNNITNSKFQKKCSKKSNIFRKYSKFWPIFLKNSRNFRNNFQKWSNFNKNSLFLLAPKVEFIKNYIFTLFPGCMYIVLLAKEIAITSINITSDFMLVCRRFKSECETSPIRQEILYHFSFSFIHIMPISIYLRIGLESAESAASWYTNY